MVGSGVSVNVGVIVGVKVLVGVVVDVGVDVQEAEMVVSALAVCVARISADGAQDTRIIRHNAGSRRRLICTS